jgi:hypothetical protein
LLALGEESGLPDPMVPVICFFFLIAAFARAAARRDQKLLPVLLDARRGRRHAVRW